MKRPGSIWKPFFKGKTGKEDESILIFLYKKRFLVSEEGYLINT